MHHVIYDKLKSIAKEQKCIYYSEIAPLANLDMDSPADRNKISEILGEISSYEHEHGRPMLSAVVIHKENNIPGKGFFTLARELDLYSGNDDWNFFISELRKVHEYWGKK